MTVVGYVGLHGKGKTFRMASRLLDDRKRGHHIISNFGFVDSEPVVTADDVMAVVCRQALNEPRLPVTLAIDEAGSLWDCRDARAFPEAMRILLSQCRKLHLDFVFTVQDFADVDVKLRRQCHEVIEVDSFFPKPYGVDEITGEVLKRPRLFRERVWDARKFGASKERPRESNWSVFDWDVAAAYDTDKLIVTLGEVLAAEWERLGRRTSLIWDGGAVRVREAVVDAALSAAAGLPEAAT